MKNRLSTILLLIAIGMIFLGVNRTYAGTAYSDGRAYLRQGSPQNAGKVYVSTSSTAPATSAYKTCNTVQTSESTTPSATAQFSGENKKTTYHFWAQANAGYKFTGWYNSTGVLQGSGAEHISASITSGTAGTSDTHAYLDMHASFIKIIQMSFVVPENGSFTITHNGSDVANYAAITVDGTVKLTALPADGYKLRGWYTTTNGGVTKNYFAFASTCEPNFTSNVTIGAEFVPDDGQATFWIKGTNKIYNNLNTANTNASSGNIIVVVSDGVVGSGTYSIKSGVTLLIPYNETFDLMTTPKVQHYTSASSAPALSAFRKLTLAAGATINVSGNICIGGQMTSVNGGNPSSQPCGAVGVLDLSRGGTINLLSGAVLYSWGFVKGQDMDQGNNTEASGVGVINAESGSTVWEDYQVGEWRGGSASSTIYGNKSSWKFFPFQSYTVQNVEAPVNYANGSNLKCYWAIYGNGTTYTVSFPLVANSGSLFKLGTSGTLMKWYDPTTDRVCYELGGGTTLDALTLSVAGESVSSSDYNLPIPANMHILLKSGNTLTVSKPMTMHAGSVVEVKSGATLNVNAKVYMYDADDWDTYCMYAYYYRTYKNLTSHYDRGTGTSKANLEDATLIVDGTVNVGAQNLYVTAGGASIIGNGGGTFKYGTLPGNTTMTQCKTLCDAVSVNIRSANLKNDNESFTKGIASTTFKNVNGRWFTDAASKIKSNNTYDFTYIKSGDVYGTGGTNTTVSACYSKDKTGLELCDKWANITDGACDNWWTGIDDGHLYNWTLNSAWHQYIKTGSTSGSEGELPTDEYAGSDGNLYTKQECNIADNGSIDANCLYTIGGVKKALVNGSFIAVVKNTDDEAYHKSDAATTYYLCFDGCVWHPATKVSGKEKAYTVDGTVYIWYNGGWLAVQNDATVGLYYSLSSTNVKIFYDYVSSAWTLATPVAEVVTSAGTEQVYALATAITKAKAGGTNVTIRLLKNMTISTFTYDGANNCSLDLNGYTLTGTKTDMITINNASCSFIIKNQSFGSTGKINIKYDSSSAINGINVTKGHLIINSGTVHIENTNASAAAYGVTVKSGHKFTINGGKLEVTCKGESRGVYTANSTASVVNINGGTVQATTTSTGSTATSAIYSEGGKINVNAGTLTASTTTGTGVKCVNITNGNSTLNISGGTIKATAKSTVYGVYIGTATGSTTTITGGTINATGSTGGTVRGVLSYANTTISGGTIKATGEGSDVRGVYAMNGTTTINNGATITATATTNARGVSYANNAATTVVVNGGTFNVSTSSTTSAYGVYAEQGTGTVNDGTFTVTSKTTDAYGIFVAATNTPKLTVNGGKFKVASEATSPSTILLCNSAAATANFIINGGYYNLAKNETTTTGTEDGYTTYPNLSIAKYKASGKLVKELDATVEASLISAGYGCKVAGKEYTVTWKTKKANGTQAADVTTRVESGKVPAYPNSTPVNYTNSWGYYKFIGWSATDGGDLLASIPAVAASDVTYFAKYEAQYAEVIAGGTTTQYNSAQTAWTAAMAYTNATIRILTNVSNMTQLNFTPTNANSIITFDLNGHYWIMNGADADRQKSPFLNINKTGCKLIITDNSASGNGYLMNSWEKSDNPLYCVNIASGGELVLQGGGIKAKNTSTAKYSVGVNISSGGKFTMTGGTVYATDGVSPRGVNIESGGNANIDGGTVEGYATAGSAYGLLPYGTATVGGSAIIKATTPASTAYATETQGTLTINGGTFEATAASEARGLFANNGTITVDGEPIVTVKTTTGINAFGAYAYNTNGNITIESGTFTVTAEGENSTTANGVKASSNGKVTVNGGTFSVKAYKSQSQGIMSDTNGKIDINGGDFTVDQNVPANGNIEGVRVYPGSTVNISGGTITVLQKSTSGNAIRCFGGTTTITGNPTFDARYGITINYAIATTTATVTVDGGTFKCLSWGLQSNTVTTGSYTLTGDVTVWDGKFHSDWNAIDKTSPTANLKIRGGWFTNNTENNLTNYVVSPSTTEAVASGTAEYTAGYRYHVKTAYNVTWSVNGTNTTQTYNRNETPSYGSTPAINDGNTWEFVGWSPEIAPVTTDVTYTAVFKKYEAEIILPNGTSKRYESFATAWADVKQIQTATIRLLSDVSSSAQLQYNPAPPSGTIAEDEAYFTNATTTLDLNNHTLAYTGTADRFMIVNKAGSKLTVADNSVAKGGKIDYTASYNGAMYTTVIYAGELLHESGKIRVQNTYDGKGSRAVVPCASSVFTMTGGTVEAYAKTDSRGIARDGSPTIYISGGNIISKALSGTDTWGATAYGLSLDNGTAHISGNPVFTVEAANNAMAVYTSGAAVSCTISGGTFNATTKTGTNAFCISATGSSRDTISGGTFNAVAATTTANAVRVAGSAAVTITGGTFTSNVATSQSQVLLTTGGTLYVSGGNFEAKSDAPSNGNIEALRLVSNNSSQAYISGGTFKSPRDGIRNLSGKAIISGTAEFNAPRVVVVSDTYTGSGSRTDTVIINGGTFIGSTHVLYSSASTSSSNTATGQLIVNGGYFCGTNSNIAVKGSTGKITLNGGKYNEKSGGTTFKTQITNNKGATTTITDISENKTIDGTNYTFVYELKTPFTVTWNAGSSYTKTETLQSGTTPTNTEVTSFVRNDSTFYFTGWTPTPTPIYGDVTYEAEGEYHVAKVKIGTGAWTFYDDFYEAWNAVQNSTTAQTYITLLNNVELTDKILHKPAATKSRTTFDLNNFTLSYTGTEDRLLEFNKTDAILTITDGSTAKGGTLSNIQTYASNLYTVVVSGGELKMEGGRIYVQNDQNNTNWHPAIAVYVAGSDNAKLTMTGGTLESKAKYLAYALQSYGITNITGGTIKANSPGLDNGSNAYAVGIYTVQRTTTFGGTAHIDVSGLMNSFGVMATGWISNDGQTILSGTINITGGTIDVTATQKNVYGIQVNATSKLVDETYHGAHGIVNVSGGTVNVTCSATTATQVFAAQVAAARQFDSATPHNLLLDEKPELNISGGTFTVDTRNKGAWVTNGGNVDLLRNWGTLNVTGGEFTIYQNTNPVGVSSYRNKATISGNPVFNIYANSGARGVIAAPWNSEGYCDKDATKNIGEVEVNGGTFNIVSVGGTIYGAWAQGSLANGNTYAMNAKATINGGEFICISGGSVYAIRQENTRTGTYGNATAQMIVNGGKFKALKGTELSYTPTEANIYVPSGGGNLTSLTGGYYVNNNQLATHVADTCVVRTLTDADAEYANGYRYVIDINYVAQVKVGSTVKKFTIIKNAFDYFATVNNATLTILSDCVLAKYTLTPTVSNWQGIWDLNGKTVTCTSGNYEGLRLQKADAKLTIRDSSAGKAGLFIRQSTEAAPWGLDIEAGEIVLESGTIKTDATNAANTGTANGICLNKTSTNFTMTGGKIEVESVNSARGISSEQNNSQIDISAGEIEVTGQNTTYGIYSSGTNSATITGGSVTTESKTNNASIAVYSLNGATCDISDGTFVSTSISGASNISPVRTGLNATMTITGGTFNGGEDGTLFQAISIRGGETTISGGTFNAAVGIRAMDWADATTITGKLTVSGGTFNTTGAVIHISSKNNNSRNAHSEVEITGGRFKTTGSTLIQFDATPSGATASTLSITGGYYNETSGTTFYGQLTPYVSDPYEVFTLENGDANKRAGYSYEVCEKRVAKVKTGSTTTYYTTVLAAMNYAKTVTNPTITILHDCDLTARWVLSNAIDNWQGILDLNGKTVTGTGTSYGVIDVTKAGTKLTIRDSSAGALGKITHEEGQAAHWGININNGAELKLESGTIYVKNTKTDNADGTFTVGICVNSSGGTLTMTGGKIDVHAAKYTKGVYMYGGTANISGGEISVSNDLNPSSIGKNAYSVSQDAASTITINGTASLNATASAYACGIIQNVASQTANISGSAKITTNAKTQSYCIYQPKAGTINISGNADLQPSATTQEAAGVYQSTGTVNVSGTVGVSSTAPTKAYAFYLTGSGSVLNVEGSGTYTASAKTTAECVSAGSSSRATLQDGSFTATTNITDGTNNAHTLNSGSSALITVSGGTYTALSKTDQAQAVLASTNGKFTITGGTFNANSSSASYGNVEVVRTFPGTTVNISGGTFNSSTGTSCDAARALGGTLTINGGTFNSKNGVRSSDANIGSTALATVVINDGTFNCSNWAIWATTVTSGSYTLTSDFTINGGKFKTTGSGINIIYGSNVNGLKIKGGYYSNNGNVETYCVAPKHCVSMTAADKTSIGADYNYKVVDAYTLTWTTDGDVLTGTYTNGITAVGTPIVAPATPTKTGYTFAAWSPAVAATMPAANTTYTAQWSINSYKITWKDDNGNVLKEENVTFNQIPSYGTNPTKSDDDDYSYTFAAWTPAITNVTGEQTYTATYTSTERFYGETYNLDITDWSANGTLQSIKINMNQYLVPTGKTQWSVAVNGNKYKNATASRVWDDEDHALTISNLTLTAGSELTIKTFDGITDDAECISRLKYKIPEIITANKTITTAQSSILYVRAGTLTINGNINVERVYVNPGAKLVINTGKTLTVSDRIVLRTQAQQNVYYNAPELINNGTLTLSGSAKMYYSRIVSDNSQAYQIGFPFATDLTQTVFSNGKTATKGAHYGILYYDSQSRADNGIGNNWKTLETTTLEARRGYQIITASLYYYEILFPVNYSKISNGATINITAYGDANTAEGNKGWNYIVHPYTSTFNCSYSDPAENIKVNILDADNHSFAQDVATALQPATPFYYQAKENGTLVFDNSNFRKQIQARTPQQSSSTQWVRLMFSQQTGEANAPHDVTNLYFSPDKFTPKYDLGYDVVKLSKTANRPLIWTTVAYGDMAFTALPDSTAEQLIPLTTFSNQATDYTFYLEATEYLNRVENVYLYDTETGNKFDLLMSDYTTYLEKGTTQSRFFLHLKFRAPSITTDIENNEGGNNSDDVYGGAEALPRKEYINGILYIIMPDGAKYDATGRKVR